MDEKFSSEIYTDFMETSNETKYNKQQTKNNEREINYVGELKNLWKKNCVFYLLIAHFQTFAAV